MNVLTPASLGNTLTVALQGGVLHLNTSAEGYPVDELCGFASRRNPKRGFLFVSKVLGKHVPVPPSAMVDSHRQLATKLQRFLAPQSEALFLGFAETATGLGAGVFDACLRLNPGLDALYLQTTRYRFNAPLVLHFQEEHSHSTGHKFDLDVSVFALGANGKIVNNEHFIFYNQLQTKNGSIKHNGDNQTGNAAGDDETVDIDLALLDPAITEISVIVTIDKASERGQNFGQVKNSAIRLYDGNTKVELAHYNLEDDFSTETAVQFGSLYKKDGQWLFKAVGAGFKKGLSDFVAVYTE